MGLRFHLVWRPSSALIILKFVTQQECVAQQKTVSSSPAPDACPDYRSGTINSLQCVSGPAITKVLYTIVLTM